MSENFLRRSNMQTQSYVGLGWHTLLGVLIRQSYKRRAVGRPRRQRMENIVYDVRNHRPEGTWMGLTTDAMDRNTFRNFELSSSVWLVS